MYSVRTLLRRLAAVLLYFFLEEFLLVAKRHFGRRFGVSRHIGSGGRLQNTNTAAVAGVNALTAAAGSLLTWYMYS